MFLDGNAVASDSELTATVCIVGAGAAGVTLADALVRKGIDVLVLESGGLRRDRATTDLAAGRNAGVPLDNGKAMGLEELRERVYGGSSTHWGGWCKPYVAADFDAVPTNGNVAWPLAFAELERYYPAVHDLLALGPYGNEWDWFAARHQTGSAIGDSPSFATRVTQITNDPRVATKLQPRLDASPRARVVLNANVVRIALAPDGTRVDRLEVATLNGRRFRARATRYVVATGGIEVPRLLLASNDVHTTGVGNAHDHVGRYFMEHVDVDAGEAVMAASLDQLRLYTVQPLGRAATDPSLIGSWTITPAAQRAQGLGAIEVSPQFAYRIDDPIVARSRRHDFPGDKVPFAGMQELVRRVAAPAQSYVRLRAVVAQAPNRQSRVRLDRTVDALGMPRAVLDWRLTRTDRDTIARGTALFGATLARVGLGRVRLDVRGHVLPPRPLDALADINYPVGSSYHHMGTARMSASPSDGVVDANCAVHGVPNLFIAGSAVFPTASTATPTLTLLALALRLADHLSSRA